VTRIGLGAGRRRTALGGSCAVLCGPAAQYHSGVCVEKSLQRAGGNPAGTSAGNAWDIWRDPQPELFGAAHYLSGVSADVSLWSWSLAGGCVTSAASGTDPSRGKVAARALRRRVRCLL
jgi:hypothetical protein